MRLCELAGNGLPMKWGDRHSAMDRTIRAFPDDASGLHNPFRRVARPIAIVIKRWTIRWLPVLRPSAPRSALQWLLLSRIDLTVNNVGGPPHFDRIESQACSARQVMHPAYSEWAALLGELPRFHRKQWEHITILEVARQAGLVAPGGSALGFGVGSEPVPAALASLGLSVLATDQPRVNAGHWTRRGEHADSLEPLSKPTIIHPARFRKLVQFRSVDMNDLPEDLGTHDLVWSACAIEHLGSPEQGLHFVRQSLRLLRPGGLAVHTTELDLTPGESTIDYGNCALYRPLDLQRFQQDVVAMGYAMTVNPYVPLEHPADRLIAPPMSVGKESVHLKLALYDSITTSFVLVIRRPAEPT